MEILGVLVIKQIMGRLCSVWICQNMRRPRPDSPVGIVSQFYDWNKGWVKGCRHVTSPFFYRLHAWNHEIMNFDCKKIQIQYFVLHIYSLQYVSCGGICSDINTEVQKGGWLNPGFFFFLHLLLKHENIFCYFLIVAKISVALLLMQNNCVQLLYFHAN